MISSNFTWKLLMPFFFFFFFFSISCFYGYLWWTYVCSSGRLRHQDFICFFDAFSSFDHNMANPFFVSRVDGLWSRECLNAFKGCALAIDSSIEYILVAPRNNASFFRPQWVPENTLALFDLTTYFKTVIAQCWCFELSSYHEVHAMSTKINQTLMIFLYTTYKERCGCWKLRLMCQMFVYIVRSYSTFHDSYFIVSF